MNNKPVFSACVGERVKQHENMGTVLDVYRGGGSEEVQCFVLWDSTSVSFPYVQWVCKNHIEFPYYLKKIREKAIEKFKSIGVIE